MPNAGEVSIRVRAAGINRADLLQSKGNYRLKPEWSPIPGLECAGEIAEVGEGVTRWKVGDRVCALLTGGGYAEYATTPATQCLPIPANLDYVQAAALPEALFTVWLDVWEFGQLKPGESLLVHGGSSGIGTTAIQMARELGSPVYVTAGSDEKCEACRKLGAVAINYKSSDFEKEIATLTAGRGVDVVLDMVGGSYVSRNLRAMAPGGRLVYIYYFESAKAEIDLSLIMGKRLTITGSALRPQSNERKAALARAIEDRVWPFVAQGKIRPVIDSVYPLAEVQAAHRRMESNAHIGKIVLSI